MSPYARAGETAPAVPAAPAGTAPPPATKATRWTVPRGPLLRPYGRQTGARARARPARWAHRARARACACARCGSSSLPRNSSAGARASGVIEGAWCDGGPLADHHLPVLSLAKFPSRCESTSPEDLVSLTVVHEWPPACMGRAHTWVSMSGRACAWEGQSLGARPEVRGERAPRPRIEDRGWLLSTPRNLASLPRVRAMQVKRCTPFDLDKSPWPGITASSGAGWLSRPCGYSSDGTF